MNYEISNERSREFANLVRGVTTMQGGEVAWLPSVAAYATMLAQGWEPKNKEALTSIEDYFAYLFPSETDKWDTSSMPVGKFTNEELAGVVMSETWEVNMRYGDSSTPKSITDVALAILDIQPSDAVADLCVGAGCFMRELDKAGAFGSFFGIDISYEAQMLALMRSTLLDGNVNISLGDTFNATGKYDKVFVNAPLGMRVTAFKKDKDAAVDKLIANNARFSSADWLFALHAIENLSSAGKAVMVTSGGPLANASDAAIREQLATQGLIEAIVAMPKNLFLTTGIQSYLVVLSRGNDEITLVDATDQGTMERRQVRFSAEDVQTIVGRLSEEGERSRRIAAETIETTGWLLDARRYLDIPTFVNAEQLGSLLTNITRGAGMSGRELDERITEEKTPYRYLRVKDLVDGEISSDLPYLNGIEPNEEKYCVQDGDIVLGKMPPFKVAVAKVEPGEKILATGNVFILRPDTDKVTPTYLKMFFESAQGLAQLNSALVGTTIMSLPIKGLSAILVPMKELDDQKDLSMEYRAIARRIETHRKQIANLEEKMRELFAEGGVA